jgi:hypothetical protein
VGRGRLVSRYPKDWKARVWHAFNTTDQNAKKRLDALLIVLTSRMIARGSRYDGNRPWLDNAVTEHARARFHAILARTKPGGIKEALAADSLDEESEPLWKVETGIPVPREPKELASAVAPMLRCASEIVFVDPHFDPTLRRFVRTLEAFLEVAFCDRPCPPPSRIEVQTSSKLDRDYFVNKCRDYLPAVVPYDVELRLVRKIERSSGEKLHNRFILTDIGGVMFGIGLDDPGGDLGQSDDLHLLDRRQYQKRWAQYAGEAPAFDIDGRPTTIEGRKPMKGRKE